MAEAKKAESTEASAPKKKSKLLLIIIVGVVLALVIGGGAVFFLMKKQADVTDEEGEEPPAKEQRAKKAKKEHPDAPPVFVKLDPFTVKLSIEGQEAYLQAVPELRVVDALVGEKIKQYMPEIRHKVLLLLSGKKAGDLSTPQGVQKLSNEIRVTINAILEPPAPRKKGKAAVPEVLEASDYADPNDPVQAVLFTSFIVQ